MQKAVKREKDWVDCIYNYLYIIKIYISFLKDTRKRVKEFQSFKFSSLLS